MMMVPNRQHDLFEGGAAAIAEAPDPARMRQRAIERLEAMLAELRAASRMPWDERRARLNRIVFPQMVNWLPREEAEAKLAAFQAELRRLGAA